MKTSEIKRVVNDDILIIRKSYIDLCDGDKNAGILLSYFEYWHNVKVAQNIKSVGINEVAESHGDEPTQDTSLFQYHSSKEIYDQCLGMVSIKGIQTGRKKLVDLGFISEHKNPNPKYKFDNTIFYLLDTVKVNESISQNDHTSLSKQQDELIKTTTTITETTTETTTEREEEEEEIDFLDDYIEFITEGYKGVRRVKAYKAGVKKKLLSKDPRTLKSYEEFISKYTDPKSVDIKELFDFTLIVANNKYLGLYATIGDDDKVRVAYEGVTGVTEMIVPRAIFFEGLRL